MIFLEKEEAVSQTMEEIPPRVGAHRRLRVRRVGEARGWKGPRPRPAQDARLAELGDEWHCAVEYTGPVPEDLKVMFF